MSWQHFHFVCRKSVYSLEEGVEISKSIDEAFKSKQSFLYGKPNPKNKMINQVFDQVKLLDQDSAIKALKIYGKLNFDKLIVNWDFMHKKIGYFAVLLSMYFTMSVFFMNRILPTYQELNVSNGSPGSELSNWYALNYHYLNISLVSCFLLLIFLNFYIKKLLSYDSQFLNSFIFKLFPSKKFKQSISRLYHYLEVPTFHKNISESDELILRNAHDELTILIEYESKNIQARLTRFSSIISAVAYIILVACISLYLAASYIPLFNLGNLI